MSRYIMVGKYSSEAIDEISSNRTEKAIRLIRELGGDVNVMYAVLGGFDLLLIVDFPKVETAMKASLGLAMLTGISFATYPVVNISDFDNILAK